MICTGPFYKYAFFGSLLFGDSGLSSLNMNTTTALGLFVGIGAGAFVVSSGLYDYNMKHVDDLIE
jgi:hypothetical protein